LLEVLGDEYISQHVFQAYGDYLEQTSYKVYMSNMVTELARAVTGQEVEKRWSEILQDIEESTAPEKQTETELEIKNRILAKLNGKEG
jgi:L-rhamnose mutarotase